MVRHEETLSATNFRRKQREAEAATVEQDRERRRIEGLSTGGNSTGAVAEGVVNQELFYSRLGYAEKTPPT